MPAPMRKAKDLIQDELDVVFRDYTNSQLRKLIDEQLSGEAFAAFEANMTRAAEYRWQIYSYVEQVQSPVMMEGQDA